MSDEMTPAETLNAFAYTSRGTDAPVTPSPTEDAAPDRRETLERETLAMMERLGARWLEVSSDSHLGSIEHETATNAAAQYAYAAHCVKENATHTAFKLELLAALGPCAPEHEGRSVPDAIRALRDQLRQATGGTGDGT